jgi:Heparinase II/III-like protein/Heparinase II/III N-terminus
MAMSNPTRLVVVGKETSTSSEAVPPARATFSAKHVILKHERDNLVATVVSDATRTGQFAFYLFRNGKRVYTQWYSSNPAMRFRIHREPGLYRVLAFFLAPNGSRMTKYSNPVFLYPRDYTLGQSSTNPHKFTLDPAAARAACLLQPRRVFRSDTRWGRSVLEWPSLDALLATAEVQSGVHSVPIGEFAGKQINYDFFLTARPGTVLLCHFHGNAPREGNELPVFTGLGVTSSIATSMFVPSDPVLALDASLSLAWHFGCEGIQLQAITIRIVQKLQTLLQAPRVVAWGGSGGGFAAIRVAKDVPNAIALVWNPQTDIAKYVPEPVARYRSIAFPRIAAAGTFPSDGEQFPSLCTEAFRAGYQGRILYLQERTDSHHVDAHLKPFLESFCAKPLSNITNSAKLTCFVTDQLFLHIGHWADGHIPPSKSVLTNLLGLLSDVTMSLEGLQNLKCLPDEVIGNMASKVSQHALGRQMIGKIVLDTLGSSSKMDLPLALKAILAIRMDRIADDFLPFEVTVSCSGETVTLPLFTGEIVEVSLSHGVQWDRKFGAQHNSSVMHLFSLSLVGQLLATFLQRNDGDALRIAVVMLESFLNYSSVPDNQVRIGRIPSGDHSAATRVKVLIKFMQAMREAQDIDGAFLQRVCDCLKYWSDWLADPNHYKKNNHGLMGSISLLHSAVQFGDAPYASAYLDVASTRIMELGKSSFDRDGLCDENSIGYHNFNLHCYRGLLEFCKHYRLSENLITFLEELIHRATNALEFCVWQDGSVPPIGDSQIYQLQIASRNEPRCFYESGFAVVKNNELYLSILCGARTEIHKQVDDTSMTLRYKNLDILIDGGAYLYDQADPYRRCVESSLGHSGIFLKEFGALLRKEFLKEFGPVSGKIERFEESHDGVRVKCVYSVRNGRTVFTRHIFVCWPDEVAIVDSIELGEVDGSAEAVQRFIFGQTLDVRFDDRNKLILTSENFSCTLFQLLDCEGDLYRGEEGSLVRGWFSKKYKEILPTFGVDFVGSSPMNRFSTIIKIAKCVSLSDCSTTVRAFANGADPFLSKGVRHSAS